MTVVTHECTLSTATCYLDRKTSTNGRALEFKRAEEEYEAWWKKPSLKGSATGFWVDEWNPTRSFTRQQTAIGTTAPDLSRSYPASPTGDESIATPLHDAPSPQVAALNLDLGDIDPRWLPLYFPGESVLELKPEIVAGRDDIPVAIRHQIVFHVKTVMSFYQALLQVEERQRRAEQRV